MAASAFSIESVERFMAACRLSSEPTDAQREEQIRSIPAEQIEDIAYYLIARVAGRFKLGVEAIQTLPVPEIGDIAVHSSYDPTSSLFTWLLEPIKTILTNRFSLPSSFLTEGAIIPLFNEEQTGLLDQIQNESGKVEKQSLVANSAFPQLTKMHLHLKLDPAHTKELFFSLEEFIDNDRKSFSGETLPDFHLLRCQSLVNRPAFGEFPATN